MQKSKRKHLIFMRKERICRYGNENIAPQVVGFTLIKKGKIRKKVI